MNIPVSICRSADLACRQKPLARCIRFVCMVVCIAAPISVWAETNNREINIDAGIRSLMGPGSYEQWEQQPDGSWLGPSLSNGGSAGDAFSGADNPGQVAAECYAARDFTNAAEWSTEAAKQGNALGATVLGLLALEGKGGVPRDELRALTLFQFAAEQGYTYAMLQLADCYRYGKGVEADRSKAIKLLKVAAARQDDDAMRSLARIYLDQDQRFGKRNYLAAGLWAYRGFRQHLKIELAAENSFVVIQVIEAVAVLIVLTVIFLATRYVWRLVREFRRPSFLEPESPVKFVFVEDPEEYKRLVSEYRDAQIAGNRSLPAPVLIKSAEGAVRDENILLGLDSFWGRMCRWVGVGMLLIIGIGFTGPYHWSAHWMGLLASLAVLVIGLSLVWGLRERWLFNQVIQTRRVGT